MFRLIVPALVGFALAVVSPVCCADDASPLAERVLVLRSSPDKKDTPAEDSARAGAYDGIVQQLAEKGFRVVDKSAAEKASLQIASTLDPETSRSRAASYGLTFFAEYTVFFTISTVLRDGEESRGALVRISSRIIDNTSAQVVASKVAEASSTGLSLADAAWKASRIASKKVGAQLAAALAAAASESSDRGRLFTVILENRAADGDLLRYLALLEKTNGILAVREAEAGGGKSTVEIMFRGKRDALDRVILEAGGRMGWKMSRIRAEGTRSSWRID